MPIKRIVKPFDNSGSRNDVRKRIVNCFLLETPGRGKGSLVSKYNYIVRICLNGNKIVLTRPANLKNGFDFLIRVEGINFNKGKGRIRDYPKHDDIFDDLKNKKKESPVSYRRLYSTIKEIFDCKNVPDEIFERFNFKTGYEPDMVTHVIKWFFIEQDIRYWNYSGRNMFMSGIPKTN